MRTLLREMGSIASALAMGLALEFCVALLLLGARAVLGMEWDGYRAAGNALGGAGFIGWVLFIEARREGRKQERQP